MWLQTITAMLQSLAISLKRDHMRSPPGTTGAQDPLLRLVMSRVNLFALLRPSVVDICMWKVFACSCHGLLHKLLFSNASTPAFVPEPDTSNFVKVLTGFGMPSNSELHTVVPGSHWPQTAKQAISNVTKAWWDLLASEIDRADESNHINLLVLSEFDFYWKFAVSCRHQARALQ